MVLRPVRTLVVAAHQIRVTFRRVRRHCAQRPLDLQHLLAVALLRTAAHAAHLLACATRRPRAQRLKRILVGDVVLRANGILFVRAALLGARLAL